MSISDILSNNLDTSLSNYFNNSGSISDVIKNRDAMNSTTSSSNYYNSIINDSFNSLEAGTGSSSTKSDAISAAKSLVSSSTTSDATSKLKSSVSGVTNKISSTVSGNTEEALAIGHSSKRIANQSDMRIKLRPKSGISSIASSSVLLKPLVLTNGFVFPYKPRFNVRHFAKYGSQTVSHANQDFRYYMSTPAQTFDISGDLTAQDQSQAEYMLATFHFFSLMTKMRFGSSDENAGLPPPILLLSGYGPYSFNDLPVIVESFTYNHPNDVDYVDVTINQVKNKVPTFTTISINVTVQNTPEKLRTFNWDKFASGSLLSSGGWK